MNGLPQDLLLLSLDERTGRIHGPMIGYGFAGAILVELVSRERISFTKKRVDVLDKPPTGDPLLDEVIERIRLQLKRRSLTWWVTRITNKIKRLPSRVAEPLVMAGVLHEEVRRVLFLFPVRRFLVADPGRQSEVIERVRAVVLRHREPDPETLALIALSRSVGILRRLFDGDERSGLRKRLKELTSKELIGEAVGESIAAVNAAVAAAAAAASVATSAGSH